MLVGKLWGGGLAYGVLPFGYSRLGHEIVSGAVKYPQEESAELSEALLWFVPGAFEPAPPRVMTP